MKKICKKILNIEKNQKTKIQKYGSEIKLLESGRKTTLLPSLFPKKLPTISFLPGTSIFNHKN
jgi:hypothetical protein